MMHGSNVTSLAADSIASGLVQAEAEAEAEVTPAMAGVLVMQVA
jgi:hypothetical protein